MLPSQSSTETQTPWEARPYESSVVPGLVADLGCPIAIAQILAARGVLPSTHHLFFNATLDALHPPLAMLGMATAVDRIRRAVQASETILIYGDYDVDGTTATVLLKAAIDRLRPGEPSLVTWHIPHRIREGYGMQGARLAEAHAAGVRLVISVDTGVRAFAAAEEARALGLDLIVTDHHLPDQTAGVPDALAVLNPAQSSCAYPCKQLCGAAVAFKLAQAILEAHAYGQPDAAVALRDLRERLLPSLLKLVAIATIADAVPLLGENRVLATIGLAQLANPVQPGLRALMTVAGLPLGQTPSATEIGFRLAPRINAAGRMDVADTVIELFLTRSEERAVDLAQTLDQHNLDRKAAERDALLSIESRLIDLADPDGKLPPECLVLDDLGWHRGVLGILASRVSERSDRPALVLTHEGDQCHGSGRSIPGFHLLDALTAAHLCEDEDGLAAPLFSRFGGHAHAVGFSLPVVHLPALRRRLQRISAQRLFASLLKPALRYDAEVEPADLTLELADWLSRCEPFGNGNPEPRLLVRRLELAAPVRIIKDRHLCLSLRSAPSMPPLQAVAWSRAAREWVPFLQTTSLDRGTIIDLIGRLRKKSSPWFHGFELEIDDMRPSC